MKTLIKTFKYISVLILAVAFIGCEDDDVVLPQVVANFTYTIDANTRTVTFINTSEKANKYTWDFGDQGSTSSNLINPVFTFPIGSYKIVLTAKNVAGASDTFEDTIIFLDQDVPLITLIGDATINVTLGDDFTDQGATAIDEVDGDLTANIVVGGDTVDTNTEGTYVITYDVSDAQGNAAIQVERTVIVSAIACDAETVENIDPANGDLNWTFLTNDITHTFEAFGDTSASIVDNPLIDGINTSCNVQQFIKTDPCQTWSGMGTELATALDFTARINNVFKMKVLAETQVTDVTLRLERLPFPDADPAVEKVASITATGEWQELTFDFSDISTGTYKSMIIYFERNANCDGDIYYFDDIVQTSEASAGGGGSDEDVILSFENNLAGVMAEGFETSGTLIPNPVSGGINTTPNVYEASYTNGNQWWGGVGFVFDAGLDQATTVYKAKFYSTVAPTNVLFQVEVGGTNSPVGAVQEITTANEWVELTFTLANIPSGVNRILIRPDVGNQDETKPNTGSLYIDDITKVNDGSGGSGDCPEPPTSELLSNGDFEAGDVGCWQFFAGTSISTTINNGGSNSAQLLGATGAAVGIKQERFGAGSVLPNTSYTVTFDIIASETLPPGSVFKAFTFSEGADGGSVGATQHVLTDSTTDLATTWDTKTYTFTTPGNANQVEGGISFLLEIVNSPITINIDNVVIKATL